MSPDGDLSFATLAVGYGIYVYHFTALGRRSDPMSDIFFVADRLFNVPRSELSPVTDADYRTDGVWAQLPKLEHLPPGFVYGQEWWVVKESPQPAPSPAISQASPVAVVSVANRIEDWP